MIKGLEKAIRNLNKEISKIDGLSAEGLLAAAVFIKGEAQEFTPVEKGILVNSAFVDPDTTPAGHVVRVGYTAEYAPAVHELPADSNFTKPGTGPKFLENAIDQNTQTILKIIRNRVKF